LRHDFKAKHIGLPSSVLKSAPKPRAVVFQNRALGDPSRALTLVRHGHEIPDE
jgi:hypothetical protein